MIEKALRAILLVSAVAIGLLFVFPGQAKDIAVGLTVFIVVLSVVEGMLLYDGDFSDE